MELLLDTAATSMSETPVTSDTANCSGWGAPYLHKLAHLDMQLYYDFYAVWVSLMVCNGVMLVLGVVLNGLALYVFCGPHHAQSASVVYTVNLAVADLLVALSLPARIALYHSGGRCEACAYVHAFSYFVNMYCSILFLTSICIDRYLAVVHASCTLLPWRSTGAARCVSVVVWTLAVVVTYSFQTTALELSTSCVVLPALLYVTILEFLLPLLAVVGFTLRVACFLSTGGGLTAHQHSRARKARAVKLLTAVLLVFTVCFTPFHVRQVLVYSGVRVGAEGLPATGHVLAYHITVTLSSLNSCLDPVVYCLVTDSFKRVWRTRRRGGEAGLSKSAGAAVAIAHRVAALTLTSAPTSPDTAVVDHKHAHNCVSVGTVQ
ncbi:G-protein coupled receptor 20 [Nerophis lumbriciformis]|uniref:G-protein coupled receptor 20 n=1 Tax=Nerophis lumbriciformis TaxID=546530 RepID=UPI002ADFA282|nr:G-protein coupled receptor 20-like [Nerophis lumbriciformis]XP_061822950.1 G-protein coupled receptor 20-like [Nerophis lumbriciformis]XP_061822951.1 G-protein coupled receptor 20-like [Nerophis lumbriciformis]